MTDRRTFIASGIALATALVATPARGRATTPSTVSGGRTVALVDRRLDGSAAFAATARGRGLAALQFTGDVASVWMHDLEPRLRAGPVTIAGYTSESTWFCLDLLARDFGACTVQRTAEGSAVSFVISQSPGRRAALAPAAVRAQWSNTHA